MDSMDGPHWWPHGWTPLVDPTDALWLIPWMGPIGGLMNGPYWWAHEWTHEWTPLVDP